MPAADPENEAYKHGCGLTEAAAGPHRVTTSAEVQIAVPALRAA
jgi:hypothetical protein